MSEDEFFEWLKSQPIEDNKNIRLEALERLYSYCPNCGAIMVKGCVGCIYSPKSYEEYCIATTNPKRVCPDAYTIKAQYCGNYDQTKGGK